jgi:stage V sporulation protein R
MHKGVPLHRATRDLVTAHIERLWGHEVVLEDIDGEE